MDSKNIINRDVLIAMLEENGISVSTFEGKITAVSVPDPSTTLSYSITDGELKSVHFQDGDVEIFFNDDSTETFFKIVKGRTMHSATITSEE